MRPALRTDSLRQQARWEVLPHDERARKNGYEHMMRRIELLNRLLDVACRKLNYAFFFTYALLISGKNRNPENSFYDV